jgi:putative FmdB family regulatory protein
MATLRAGLPGDRVAAQRMPIYEYECRKCGVFDHEHPMSARPLARCPRCRSKVTKLISATAFHLKGGGWYADGYDKKSSTADSDSKAETPGVATSVKAEAASKEAPSASPADASGTSSKKPKKSSKSRASGKSAAA